MRIRGARTRLGFELFAWVIMPEHVHLLLCPDLERGTTEQTLSAIKSRFACSVLDQWRANDSPWLARISDARGILRYWARGGGFDRNVRDESEIWKTVRYINHNPVKRGLVSNAEDYRWSSAGWWLDRRPDLIGIDHPMY